MIHLMFPYFILFRHLGTYPNSAVPRSHALMQALQVKTFGLVTPQAHRNIPYGKLTQQWKPLQFIDNLPEISSFFHCRLSWSIFGWAESEKFPSYQLRPCQTARSACATGLSFVVGSRGHMLGCTCPDLGQIATGKSLLTSLSRRTCETDPERLHKPSSKSQFLKLWVVHTIINHSQILQQAYFIYFIGFTTFIGFFVHEKRIKKEFLPEVLQEVFHFFGGVFHGDSPQIIHVIFGFPMFFHRPLGQAPQLPARQLLQEIQSSRPQ